MGPFWPMFWEVWVNLGNLLGAGGGGRVVDDGGRGGTQEKKSSEVRIPVNFQVLNQNQTCYYTTPLYFPSISIKVHSCDDINLVRN